MTSTTMATRCSILAGVATHSNLSRSDRAWAIFWCFAEIAARGPLVARIEGVLDHDQSTVGLMAFDIAAGRSWPIFFNGKRYMGE